MARDDEILKLGNHREARRILHAVSGGVNLPWLEAAADRVARRWFRLAQQHMRIARGFEELPRAWRVMVSRSYYAAYSASKSVRFFVDGRVSLGVDDHKKVGDLPHDFPDRERWSNFTTELRRDRNLADYDPWSHTRRALTYQPKDAMSKAAEFVTACRDYLRNRGLGL